jgi:hypothetical protein
VEARSAHASSGAHAARHRPAAATAPRQFSPPAELAGPALPSAAEGTLPGSCPAAGDMLAATPHHVGLPAQQSARSRPGCTWCWGGVSGGGAVDSFPRHSWYFIDCLGAAGACLRLAAAGPPRRFRHCFAQSTCFLVDRRGEAGGSGSCGACCHCCQRPCHNNSETSTAGMCATCHATAQGWVVGIATLTPPCPPHALAARRRGTPPPSGPWDRIL